MSEDFHNGISRELGGIHAQLTSISEEMRGMKEQMTIANGRTRKLEDENLRMKTKVGVISGLISGAVALVIWLLNYFK